MTQLTEETAQRLNRNIEHLLEILEPIISKEKEKKTKAEQRQEEVNEWGNWLERKYLLKKLKQK